MQTIFYLLGIVFFLTALNLFERWYVIAAISIFILGKYLVQGLYFIIHKQYQYQKQINQVLPGQNKFNATSLTQGLNGLSNKNASSDANYKDKIKQALQDRLAQEK